MAIRLDKPWVPVEDALTRLRGNLGVFELADADGQVVYIGFAGGKSIYGLKGEVNQALEKMPEAQFVRHEVNTAYQSRFRELLMVHAADHGDLPRYNVEFDMRPNRLGRLSPA